MNAQVKERLSVMENAWRLGQMWDWGHNCKVLSYQESAVQTVVDSYRDNYSREEWDRFWEGFNAPRSRGLLVSIKI